MVIWVIKIFLYIFSSYSWHLFLTSSASVKSIPFLSFIVPILALNVPLVSLTSLKRSLVFHSLLFSSVSLHMLLKKSGGIALGGMKRLSQSRNNAQLWICLVVKVKSNIVSIPGLGRSPGRRHGNPLQHSCLANPYEQKNLAGYSPWGCKKLDTAKSLRTAQHRRRGREQSRWCHQAFNNAYILKL